MIRVSDIHSFQDTVACLVNSSLSRIRDSFFMNVDTKKLQSSQKLFEYLFQDRDSLEF